MLQPVLLVSKRLEDSMSDDVKVSTLSSMSSSAKAPIHSDSNNSTPADTQSFTARLKLEKLNLLNKAKPSYIEDKDDDFDDFGDLNIDSLKLKEKLAEAKKEEKEDDSVNAFEIDGLRFYIALFK